MTKNLSLPELASCFIDCKVEYVYSANHLFTLQYVFFLFNKKTTWDKRNVFFSPFAVFSFAYINNDLLDEPPLQCAFKTVDESQA